MSYIPVIAQVGRPIESAGNSLKSVGNKIEQAGSDLVKTANDMQKMSTKLKSLSKSIIKAFYLAIFGIMALSVTFILNRRKLLVYRIC